MKPAHVIALVLLSTACSGPQKEQQAPPVPLPKAWPRTEIYDSVYHPAAPGSDILVNAGASVSPADRPGWLNVVYPAYRATLYLTDVTAPSEAEADEAEANRLERISLNINGLRSVESTLSTPGGYDLTLLSTPSGTLTPLQFIARRGRRIVSGALAIDRLPSSADSLAPTLAAVERDIITLVRGLR